MKLGERFKSIFEPLWSDKAFLEKSLAKKHFDQFGSYGVDTQFGIDKQAAGFGSDMWFFDNNGREYLYTYESIQDAVIAYERCPPIAAIINKKAQAFVNGKTWILDKKGKESTTDDAKKLKRLLQRPNPIQSWKQFEAQNYIYTQLFGFCVVLPIKPVGFKDNIDATSLWNIPSFMVNIVESNKIFYQTDLSGIINKIEFTYRGQKTDLNVDDVYIMKDFVPSFNSLIIPESRIRPLSKPISNIIGAYESRSTLIKHRGPQYAISSNQSDDSGNIPLPRTEKDNLINEFKRYGLSAHQSRAIITSANINITPIGFSTKDLMLFEEIESSTMALCDAFGYPYRLMAAEKSASYNDVSEFKKMLYQDAIMSEAESICEQWNGFFKAETFKIKIDKDFTHIQALQADAVQMATARKLRNEALEKEYRYNNITLNRWRELNGEDTVQGDDIYFSDFIKLNSDPYAGSAGGAASVQDRNVSNNNNNAEATNP